MKFEVMQNEPNCPKRGTEGASRRGWARRALGDQGVWYKQTQFRQRERRGKCFAKEELW